MSRRVKWQCRAAYCLAAQLLAGFSVHAATLPWTTSGSGQILAIARSGNTVFVGGAFNALAHATGQGVSLDYGRGHVQPGWPIVAGAVSAAVSDGMGGWFIGGSFGYVGEVERLNLAHIRRDGSVGPWNPAPNGAVRTLVVADGYLFVAGEFDRIAGKARGRAASFRFGLLDHANSKFPDRFASGLTSWDPGADAPISAVAVAGRSVFLGGEFLRLGEASRARLAEVDILSGRATAWAPNPNHYVRALALRGEVLYAGGYFGIVADEGRSCLAAFNVRHGKLLPLSVTVQAIPYIQFSKGPYVAALLTHGNRLYVGGYFTHVNGAPHPGLIAIDTRDTSVLSWDPRLEGIETGGACLALDVRGASLYVGGRFSGIAGRGQAHLAALSVLTGELEPWNPQPDGAVQAIAAGPQAAYIGGLFSSLGAVVSRRCLAAFDVRTGALLPWDPSPDGFVWALEASGSVVYAAGDFGQLGGAVRRGLAALDASTGMATSWNPTVSHPFLAAPVRALAAAPGRVFVGGWYGEIGGAMRRSLACIDSASGLVSEWDPSPDDMIEDLVVHGDTLYVGGWFGQIAGVSRPYLAAFSIETGTALSPLPAPDRPVTRLSRAQTTLLVAGYFDSIGTEVRNGLAAIDVTLGTILPWTLDSDAAPGGIHALAVDFPIAYLGGAFEQFEGLKRHNLAAIDLRSGTLLPWAPDADGPVLALNSEGDDLFVGGTFRRVGAIPSAGLCVLDGAATPQMPLTLRRPLRNELSQSAVVIVEPNPIRTEGLVRFALSEDGPVKARVYDLQGRCIATLLDDPAASKGWHAVSVQGAQWAAGCYLLRIETGRVVSTSKLFVVR